MSPAHPPDVAILLFPQKQHLIQRDSYPGKITREKYGEVWARNGIGNVEENANDFFSLSLIPVSPLGKVDRHIWRNRAQLFHTHCNLCMPFCKGPGLHPHKAFIILPQEATSLMLHSLWFLFYCSALRAAPCNGNNGLFSFTRVLWTRIPSHHTAILWADENTEPWPREGTGCGCASRAGVQVARPRSRGAKGQETCGAKGAEEKVGSLDLVFLMTRISKRKAGGYRKRLSLTAPGKCGKAAYSCVISWPAGAMLCRPNGLRKGSSIQSHLTTFKRICLFLFFFFPTS